MNPYQILEIETNATNSDIKKAYRKLVMKHHPDKGGDPEKFKELSQAYETLSNSQKRQQYDNYGSVNMDMNFDAMDIFKMFERDFFGPNNVGGPLFGGFPGPPPPKGMQGNQCNNLLEAMLSEGFGELRNMTQGPTFSQTTYFKDGKQITTTQHNGKTTVTETKQNPFSVHY